MSDQAKTTTSGRGVSVKAVLKALISGESCDKHRSQSTTDADHHVVISILKGSSTACACARSGMAWTENQDAMKLEMSLPSLRKLCTDRGIDPTSDEFSTLDEMRFQYHPNGTNPLGGKGVHVANVKKSDLAILLSEVVSDRLGFTVTIEADGIGELAHAIDDIAA